MAGAYSVDLRKRVLAAVEAGEAVSAVARRFAVGRSTAQDWVRAVRQDGRRVAGKMGGHRKPVITGEVEAALRRVLEGANHLTLAQCRDRLAKEAGVSVHLVTVHRALARMKWSWKKTHPARGRASEIAKRFARDREDVARARAVWHTDKAGVGGVAPERLVFLDKCGVLTNKACLHGRAPRGQRARGTVPARRWERLTVLGALGADGIIAAMSVEAAADAAVFMAYLDRVLLPRLRQVRPDAVLVMSRKSSGFR